MCDMEVESKVRVCEWRISGFTGLRETLTNNPDKHYSMITSEAFSAGGMEWRFRVYPNGHAIQGVGDQALSIYFGVSDFEKLPEGWKRAAHIEITAVNHLGDHLSVIKRPADEEPATALSKHQPDWGYARFIDLAKLTKEEGFLTDGGDLLLEAKLTLHTS